MSDKRAKRCETCEFWDGEWSGMDTAEEQGLCRRYAPRPTSVLRFREDSEPEPYRRQESPGLRSVSEYSDDPLGCYEPAYPIAWAEEWCGEWASKDAGRE